MIFSFFYVTFKKYVLEKKVKFNCLFFRHYFHFSIITRLLADVHYYVW